jgi:hypothetical protein
MGIYGYVAHVKSDIIEQEAHKNKYVGVKRTHVCMGVAWRIEIGILLRIAHTRMCFCCKCAQHMLCTLWRYTHAQSWGRLLAGEHTRRRYVIHRMRECSCTLRTEDHTLLNTITLYDLRTNTHKLRNRARQNYSKVGCMPC